MRSDTDFNLGKIVPLAPSPVFRTSVQRLMSSAGEDVSYF